MWATRNWKETVQQIICTFKRKSILSLIIKLMFAAVALLGKLSSPKQMGLYPNQGPIDIAGPT